MLLVLIGWPYFCLLFQAPDLNIDLAIEGVLSMGVEIVVGLSGFFLWKLLTSLRKC